MVNFEIKDDEQLMAILYLKDDLIHVFDEMHFARDIDYKAFKKLDNRIQLLNKTIESYIAGSDSCFQIRCLESKVIEPQDNCELNTNVLGYNLQDADIIFDGSVPSAGFLELSYESYDSETHIYVKNWMPRMALEKYDTVGYHYNSLMTTRYVVPGIYQIEKDTVIGVGCSKDKDLVRELKQSSNTKHYF